MQIICPRCAAAYEVPDHLVLPRRSVRCIRCGERWLPFAGSEPQAADPAPPIAAPPLPPAAPAAPPTAAPEPWPRPPEPEPAWDSAPELVRQSGPEPEPEPAWEDVAPRPPVAMPLGLDTSEEPYGGLAHAATPPAVMRRTARLLLPAVAGRLTALAVAWAASVVAVLALLVVLFADHDGIAQAWPPTRRLFGLFGLA